ncbi:MAG: translation initiation factor IF-2 [Desulfobacteraceae bacterium]|nr:translation initiation factor IF-2 [Pseudomonadota bacterium]MBU4464042.1 translation initiation factor IF-2 [Pseudomonadota bacterium]MCG2754300.1 translation initiation factor IF-2 [Desulfobacteraceae bacterium]
MAKIRVHEFARTLNIQNKILLEKLRDMGISVKSHMSSLDEETVARARAELFGAKTQEVEVTRVKSTVIRRRKKPVKTKLDTEAEPLKEVTPLEKKAKEKPAEKKVAEKAVAAKKKKDLSEIIEEPKQAVESVELEKKKAVPAKLKPAKALKPKKARKKEIPAKIIKMPAAPEKRVEIKPKPKPELKPEKTLVEITEPPVKKHKKKVREEKPAEDVADKKFFKKKISFRKKEIVEGKDLYARGYPGRKGRKGGKGKMPVHGQKPLITIPKAIKRRIKIDNAIVVSDLAKRIGVKASEIIKKLMSLGVMATVNHAIDFDTAAIVAAEFNYEAEQAPSVEKLILMTKKDDPDKLIVRPPVVTIMGHVDHGKTSLLDAIRKSNITDTESGGITQHIGAYCVSTDKGQIVFLDTPGHEAFTAMRARGAKVTDIVVLVVAADDGVMPQTIEAINHSKAAEVPIIVAVNKIDKPDADPERVKRELADLGLVPEDWGGDIFFVNVSAKENRGINDLLEMILFQAELLELKANPDKLSNGHVVEAKIDPGRGAVATVLVQEGTLHVGDHVVCGIHHGKVRAILNDMGHMIKSAGPSMPVEVVGLSGVPNAGDDFIALSDDKNAKQVSLYRIREQRSRDLAKTGRLGLSLEELYETMQEGEIKELNLIIKTDVQGSIGALTDSLTKLSNDEVKINITHAATGTVTESDISLAAVSKAIIIGFNVRSTPKVQAYANEESVDIRHYKIIYNVIKEIKDAILGMMSSTFEERILGRAEIREVFHIPKIGKVGGCYVTDGKVERGRSARVLRDDVICYDGKISSLHRFKDDAKEVQSGYECGIGIEKYNDIKVGDIIECYYLEEIKPELEE